MRELDTRSPHLYAMGLESLNELKKHENVSIKEARFNEAVFSFWPLVYGYKSCFHMFNSSICPGEKDQVRV